MLLVQYITSQYEPFKTLRPKSTGLLQVQIMKYLRIVNVKVN